MMHFFTCGAVVLCLAIAWWLPWWAAALCTFAIAYLLGIVAHIDYEDRKVAREQREWWGHR